MGKHPAPRGNEVDDGELLRTKFDYEVAKFLKNTLPHKEAMFGGIKKVSYLIGVKAVDLIMDSKYTKGEQAKFKTRQEVVIFLNELLLKKFYHRAKKIVRMDGTKKKFKLDMHDIQIFEDSNQPYVWLYEPVSLKAWLLCIGVILIVILICLFPLWPPIIHTWVRYLCWAGVILLSSMLAIAIIRYIIFFILLALTFGKFHFWLLPNLTEDVGFFESFWPLYEIGSDQVNKAASSGDAASTSANSSTPIGSSATSTSNSQGSHSHQD